MNTTLPKKSIIVLLVITFFSAALYMFGIPFGLLAYDIPNKIPLTNVFYTVNTVFASLFAVIMTRIAVKGWLFHFSFKKLKYGIFGVGNIFLFGVAVITAISCFFFAPLNRLPGIKEILVWVILYNLAVAVLEEILLRGLLMNTLCVAFNGRVMKAIIISSVIFGIGHIPGMLTESIVYILLKVVGSTAVGISLGIIFHKSKNLLSVTALHFLLNSSGSVAYYFSSSDDVYIVLFIWPVVMTAICIHYMVKYNKS